MTLYSKRYISLNFLKGVAQMCYVIVTPVIDELQVSLPVMAVLKYTVKCSN